MIALRLPGRAGPPGRAEDMREFVSQWHAFVRRPEPEALDRLLADDVVFYSPVVFTPQASAAPTRGSSGCACWKTYWTYEALWTA